MTFRLPLAELARLAPVFVGSVGGSLVTLLLVNGHSGDAHAAAVDTVRAGRFEVVDERGVVRAVLGLSTQPAGPILWMGDNAGTGRVSVNVDNDGTPTLWFRDAAGLGRAGLSVERDGTVGLGLYDPHGQHRELLTVGPEGSPVLSLSDGQQRVRAMLTVLPDGTPVLSLYDAAGGKRVVTP